VFMAAPVGRKKVHRYSPEFKIQAVNLANHPEMEPHSIERTPRPDLRAGQRGVGRGEPFRAGYPAPHARIQEGDARIARAFDFPRRSVLGALMAELAWRGSRRNVAAGPRGEQAAAG
jgi:hypothetical protein